MSKEKSMNEARAYQQFGHASADELLREHFPLVKKVGLHLKSRLPSEFELDDLLQVGMLGLINAAGNYDATQGASFETYASIRIRGAMLDEVRRSGWSPRSIQQKSRAVSEAIRNAEMRKGGEASDAEIASEMGLNLEEYHSISRELTSSKLVSLDEQTDENFYEPRSSVASPLDQLQDEGFKDALKDCIGTLPEKERLVMALYYTEEMNLREIGTVLDVSESRVCQIHGQALARLKARMKEWVE